MRLLAIISLCTVLVATAHAVEPAPAASVDLLAATAPLWACVVASSSAQLVATRHDDQAGRPVDLVHTPGADRAPGITITPPTGTLWDFTPYGRAEAHVTNPWVEEITVTLRVDNGPAGGTADLGNSESVRIDPGASGVVSVYFGYSNGHRGYSLDPSRVTRLLLTTGTAKGVHAFRLDQLLVTGVPGEKPVESRQQRLSDGVILGTGSTIDQQRVARPVNGAAVIAGAPSSIVFSTGTAADAGVFVAPVHGQWDLRDHLLVTVQARNVGTVPVTLRARMESGEGATPWAESGALAPGAEQELTIPFAAAHLWDGSKESGGQYASDVTTGIALQGASSGASRLEITSIKAFTPPPAAVPEWLGTRPPVSGEWTQTLAEEFDGTTLDLTRWTVQGENYSDKVSHYSRDNVLVGGGFARLHYEKKRGHMNDDPKRVETDYATGFMTSTGKWTQRYGYFESRLKVPKAAGLWPAFWMMPDRGEGWPRGPRWTTKNGGMEFDIFESMTRYGPNRYNIALHWDDYGKDHKSVGNGRFYVQPDAEGFFTAGLLWEPGKVAFYCNGTLVGSWADARVGSMPSYFIYTLPSGGWGSNVMDGSGLPDDLVIDWVRAWQRTDLAALPPLEPPAPVPASATAAQVK